MYTRGVRLLGALLLAATLGCAARADIRSPEPPESVLPYSIQVVGDISIGGACAVGNQIFTAKHVVNPFMGRDAGAMAYGSGLSWSTPAGLRGYLNVEWSQWYRDIAGLSLAWTEDLPKFWPYASGVVVGERVRWVGYVWDPGERIMASRERQGKVLRTVGGYIVFDGDPVEGSSGGCLWNDADEVLGVVVWSVENAGLAVSVAGYWWNGN